jgi:predicted RNase H-like HicB family nuclease
MVTYVGVLDGSGSVWGVRLPDLAGCVGGGETPEAAIADATSALRDVAAHRRTAERPLPVPSSVTAILASGEVGAGETIVLIPLVLDSGRTVRANLTLDAGLLEAIDKAAGDRGVSRSAFIADAARDKLLKV